MLVNHANPQVPTADVLSQIQDGARAPACSQSAWVLLAPAENHACLGCVCSFLPADAWEQWLFEGCSQRRPSGPWAGGDVGPERVGQGRAQTLYGATEAYPEETKQIMGARVIFKP